MSEDKASKKIDWNDPSVIRYHALKMKPKTIAQARRNMIKYLKNQGNYKISDFKGMSYNEIRPIFEKVWDFNQHIEPMEHGSEKMKSPEKIEEEDADTQKEMKEVVKESGAKRKKSLPRKRRKVFRGDGSSKNYKVLSEMLEDFDRQDVEKLYRLVKESIHMAVREDNDPLIQEMIQDMKRYWRSVDDFPAVDELVVELMTSNNITFKASFIPYKESSAAGTDNRPPMFVESDYESWKIRIERYIHGKPLGKLIWRSIQNGPTPHPQITVTEGEGDAATQVTTDKRDEEFTKIENNKELADIQATNILSQGLPRHVFNILNQTRTGKEIWDNVELLMKGSGKSLQQQKEELFDEYERFRAIGNESIHDYFVRFHKLINDMKITQLNIPTHQMNTKFVNNLPPYWANIVDPLAYLASTTHHHTPTQTTNPPPAQYGPLTSSTPQQVPQSSNELCWTSSNSRSHATVHDGRIVTENRSKDSPGNNFNDAEAKHSLLMRITSSLYSPPLAISTYQHFEMHPGRTPNSDCLSRILMKINDSVSSVPLDSDVQDVPTEYLQMPPGRTCYSEKVWIYTMFEKRQSALPPGMYAINPKYIPPQRRVNRAVPTPLPKNQQITFKKPPRPSNRPTQKTVVQQNKKPNVPVNLSTGVKPATGASKPMSKSDTWNHSTLPAKSDKARRVEDHHRNLK
ncbi:hypothetical protein Tco_0681198 [Tanacetum coccineum]|uniref:Retrotransposon gag domain-containing protein n=1 Tax=Tanacetum coccineum TaxID=301880 RepID=A0ABQ4XMM9_9ASTR